MKCVLRVFASFVIFGSCALAGTVTFTLQGSGTSPLRTYDVAIDSLSVLAGSQWDAVDLVIGSEDGLVLTDFAFQQTLDADACPSSCEIYNPGFGVYSSDIQLTAFTPSGAQSLPSILGTVTVDTTGLANGPYELKVDGAFDSGLSSAVDGVTIEALSGSVMVDVCEVADAPTSATGESGYQKNRYISIVPGNAGVQTALRVTIVSLDPCPIAYGGGCDFSSFNGTTMWVGVPAATSEVAQYADSTPPTFQAAQLKCSPHYRDWGAEGTVHVYGSEVVPNSIYEFQAIQDDCIESDESHYSAASPQISTSKWGDVVGAGSEDPPPTPPDDAVNITDVLAVAAKFSGGPGAVMKARADMEDIPPLNVVDRKINTGDILRVSNAFSGLTYPYVPVGCE